MADIPPPPAGFTIESSGAASPPASPPPGFHVEAPPPPPGFTIQSPPPAAPVPQAPGATSLAFQPPGQSPLYAQEAAREVAAAPGLDKPGQQAVYAKWQARAFPVLPGAPLMPSAPVQAINAMAKGPAEKLTNLASNTPVLPYVTGQTPGEWALEQRRNLERAYPSEPTAANTVAGIVGDTATALPMLAAGVPLPVMGAMEAQSELGGAHADVAQRRESGENVTPTQEAVYSGARAAKGFATMMAGGAAATSVVPKIAAAAGESALARGAAAVAGDVATQSALGAGGRVAENVTQQGVFGKDHAPGTFEGVPQAAAGGAVGGLVYAPLTYHHARNMPAGHEPPPAEIPPPPPGFTMEAPPEAPTPRQTPDAVAAVRESRMNDLAAERQRRTLERRNPVTIATENALDALDAADARTGTEQPPTQQRASGEAGGASEPQATESTITGLFNAAMRERGAETSQPAGPERTPQQPEAAPAPPAQATPSAPPAAPAQKKGPRVDAGLTNGGSPKQLPPPEAATPRAPAFTVTPGTPPVKAQPKSPQPRPQRTPFTRAMLERKLVDYHESVGGGYTADDEKALSEAGTGAIGEGAFTFAHHLPGEIKHYIQNNPAARRLFRVTSDPTKAGGEDAMSDLGERYWHIVDSRAGNSVKLAKETIRKSGDPAMQFWSAVHDNLPAAKERPAQGAVDPAELAVGQEFELNGAKFQVHEDENGLRILKDGDEYPEVPVDALAGQKIPVDTGTLKQGEEPPVPEGDFSPAEATAEVATEEKPRGIFGQETFDAATGNQTAPMFHEPVDVAAPRRPEADQRLADKFDEGATPSMFQRPAPPAKPTEAEVKAHFAEMESRKQARIDYVRGQLDENKGGRVDTEHGYLVASKNPGPDRGKYPWRITRFSADGTPTGHTVHESFYDPNDSPPYYKSVVGEIAGQIKTPAQKGPTPDAANDRPGGPDDSLRRDANDQPVRPAEAAPAPEGQGQAGAQGQEEAAAPAQKRPATFDEFWTANRDRLLTEASAKEIVRLSDALKLSRPKLEEARAKGQPRKTAELTRFIRGAERAIERLRGDGPPTMEAAKLARERAKAEYERAGQPQQPGSKHIAPADLSDVFGVDVEPEAAKVPAAPADPAREVAGLDESKMVSADDTRRAAHAPYTTGASSRTTPNPDYPYKPGQWRIEDSFGPRGRMVEKLVELDPKTLHLSEEDYTTSNAEGRGDDARRYAQWIKEGKTPPPIEVVETDSGKLSVSGGHRRVAAAKLADKPILGWVSYKMDTGRRTPAGEPIYQGLTYEGAKYGPEKAAEMYEQQQRKAMQPKPLPAAVPTEGKQHTDADLQSFKERVDREGAAYLKKHEELAAKQGPLPPLKGSSPAPAVASTEPRGLEGGRIVEKRNAVQIVFDAKPTAEMRNRLKASGFRWRPTDQAWERPAGFAALRDAQDVLGYKGGQPPAATPTPAPTPQEPAKPAQADPRVQRFRQMADAMDAQIEAKKNPAIAQQNPTRRRAGIAEGMYAAGERLAKVQRVLRNMADAVEAGTLPESLAGIKSRAQVEELFTARNDPRATLTRSQIRDLFEGTRGVRGAGAAREKVSYLMGYGDDVVPISPHELPHLETLADLAGKKGVTVRWINERLKDGKRLASAGIDTTEKLKQAKEDIRKFTGESKPDPQQQIRKMENALLGVPIPGFFPTPKPVIEKMLAAADISADTSVLEPSAGKGDILDAIKASHPEAPVKGIESQDQLAQIGRAKGHNVATGDFLSSGRKADRIVMNPPFENGQDIEHVRHAYDQLNPGGRVVAVMSEGPFYRSDKKATEFRNWLDSVGGTSEKLDEGSFTGKESFRQTGVNTRMVVIDKPGDAAGPEAADVRRRGVAYVPPLDKPAKAIAAVASVPQRVAKGAFDYWSKPLVEAVEGQAGERGKVLAKRMRAAADESRNLLGRLHAPLTEYENAVSGAPGKDFLARRRAVRELQERVQPAGKDYAYSRMQLATEGRLPLDDLSPHARAAVLGYRKLIGVTGQMAVDAGVQVTDPRTGETRPFVPARDGMRYLRQPTPEFHAIASLPEGHPLKKALAESWADANGITPAKAMEQVNQMAEGPLFKRNATETVRLLENAPAWIKNPETGRWVEVLNTDPSGAAHAMVTNTSRRLGFIKTFGQDLPGNSVSADLVDQYAAGGGDRETAKRAIRGLNGVPLDHFHLPSAPPGSDAAEVVKAVGAAYNVLRGGALTTAAVPNALESGTKSLALGGVGPWARAMWKIARHPTASRELTAAIGARTVDRVKWMTRPGRTAEDVAKAISGILTYPMKAVNEFNELHAAQTGVELAKDVRAGKNAASNSFRLELLGFSPEQAERMSQGRGTEKEYKAIATRFPLVTQGAGRGSAGSPAERSRAANSGLYQALVPFDSYAQMTANRTARLYSRWLSAMRSGTVPQKAAATKVLAQYHVGHALAGAGAAFIYAYLNGGTAGVKERAAEATDAPLAFIRDSLLNSMVGGVAGRFVNSAQRPGPTKLGDIATSMSYPASLLQEGFDAIGGTGKYRDQTPLERAGTFLSGRLTASKAVATMMATFGLGEDDHGLEAATRGYYRWRREQGDLDQDTGDFKPREGREEFRRHMRRAERRMKVADESGAQKEVGAALGLPDIEGKNVAQSIRGRKLIDDLKPEQLDRLKKRIGAEAFTRLERHDDLLESWALAMGYETPDNPGVHQRHGAALLEQHKTSDAVEKAYRPAKDALDAGDLGAARMQVQANRDTLMRKPLSDARESMLGNVRKAMKRVRESPNLSPAQKAEQLQRLESVMGRTLAAGAAPGESPAESTPQP